MSFENQSQAFSSALDYLYSFINFEKKKQDRYMESKLDSTRPKRFLDALGAPYADYPTIHIAGTKGKGSVSAMCAFALRAAGLRVGLYTSPHLVDFRERIRILTPDDKQGLISEEAFVSIMDELKLTIEQFPDVTWFEILTAVAFKQFSLQKVDIAVIEVGLGGRLDATNVVTPLVSVITSLSIDHTQFLGNTLTKIAYEKGGIIKPNVPVIVAPQQEEALIKLRHISQERQSPLTLIQESWRYHGQQPSKKGEKPTIHFDKLPDSTIVSDTPPVEVNLLGDHQIENGVVAISALTAVSPHFPTLTETAVRQGLREVQWNGRLQILHQGDTNAPTVLVDCAHNPDSAEKLRDALTTIFTYNRLWLVLGAPADKDVEGMLKILLPLTHKAMFTTASHPRSISPTQLVEMSQTLGFDGTPIDDIGTAVATALNQAHPNDLICITGSIIVVGDLLNQWERLQSLLEQKT